jgi:hypothetical protein
LIQNEQERRPCRHKPNALRTGSNRRQMSEISRSVRFSKQAKKLWTVQFVQSVHADVAGPYSPTWHDDDVAGDDWTTKWQMWANHVSARGILLANSVVPRGTLFWYVKIFVESTGVEPWTSYRMQSIGKGWAANTPCFSSYFIYVLIYI